MKDIYYTEKVKNSSLIRKRIVIGTIIVWAIIVSYIAVFIFGFNKCKKEKDLELSNYKSEVYCEIFEDSDIKKIDNQYAVMPFLNINLSDEMAGFIIKLSKELNLDPDFCIAILNKENWELDPLAVKLNSNGTKDLGLWQINSSNLNKENSKAFNKMFWKFDVEFDPFNWKHSTWVALHFIKDLYNEFGDYRKVAMAYNGGAPKVRKNRVVAMAVRYSDSVMNTYNTLKKAS